MKLLTSSFAVVVLAVCSFAQAPHDHNFHLALPDHDGELRLEADGFEIVQSSAKPGGREIGIRARSKAQNLTFLMFLFLVSNQSAANVSCRDGVMDFEKKSNPGIKIVASSRIARTDGPSADIVTYTTPGERGKTLYDVRAFVANGDLCGDLEFSSDTPLSSDDPQLQTLLESYRLEISYVPEFKDQFTYAQILYHANMYGAAGPIFEEALANLKGDHTEAVRTMRRVTTDQAVMSYGMSGNIRKARALSEKAITQDPDYPMYYYNLACADAEENNLADAKMHLQLAFARKANVIHGEAMPDPAKDDSFLPHKSDKDFWNFVENLH